MTTGIYKLVFKDTNKLYIGQSIKLETRLIRHNWRVKSGTASKKLTEAYALYGVPQLVVLLECTQEELNSNEAEAIEIFDSVANGFNTVRTMVSSALFGDSNPNAKFNNEQIIDAFKLLVSTDLKAKEIASICGISPSMVGHISCCESHKWLKNIFKEEYDILYSRIGTRKNKSFHT